MSRQGGLIYALFPEGVKWSNFFKMQLGNGAQYQDCKNGWIKNSVSDDWMWMVANIPAC